MAAGSPPTTTSRSEPSLAVARALSDTLTRYLSRTLGPAELAAELRRIACKLDDGRPAPEARQADQAAAKASAVRQVFEHWIRATGRNPKTTKLTPDRKTKVEARLREGYTVADILRAIEGLAASPFHRGENQQGTRYDDLALLCRSGSKLESFRDAAPETTTTTTTDEPDIAALQRASADALKEGDLDAYNATQARIRSLRGT